MTTAEQHVSGTVSAATTNGTGVAAKKRKRRVVMSRDFKALRNYVQALEAQTPRERRAAIRWLADFYQVSLG